MIAHSNGWDQPISPSAHQPIRTGAGDENRTHVASLEGWSFTIKLRPRPKRHDICCSMGDACEFADPEAFLGAARKGQGRAIAMLREGVRPPFNLIRTVLSTASGKKVEEA